MIIVTESTAYTLENNKKPWYSNNFNNPSTKLNSNSIEILKINVKIENDKIYYLAPILKENGKENDYGILEEREYTINNNKLEYKVVNSYKIIDTVGLVC